MDSTSQDVPGGAAPLRDHDDARHARGVSRHPPAELVYDGRHRRCPSHPGRHAWMREYGSRSYLLSGPAGVVHGGESLRPDAVVPFCAGLGCPCDHRSVHGGFHLRVSCVPGDPSGHAQLIYSAGIINNELVCGPGCVRLPRFLQSQGCDVNSKPRRGWPYCG